FLNLPGPVPVEALDRHAGQCGAKPEVSAGSQENKLRIDRASLAWTEQHLWVDHCPLLNDAGLSLEGLPPTVSVHVGKQVEVGGLRLGRLGEHGLKGNQRPARRDQQSDQSVVEFIQIDELG